MDFFHLTKNQKKKKKKEMRVTAIETLSYVAWVAVVSGHVSAEHKCFLSVKSCVEKKEEKESVIKLLQNTN